MKWFSTYFSTMHRWCCVLTVMLLMLLCAVPAQAGGESSEKRSQFENDITIKFLPDTNDCTKCKARIYLLYAHKDEDGDFDGGWRRVSGDDTAYGAHVKLGVKMDDQNTELREFVYLFFDNDVSAENLTIDTLYFGKTLQGNNNLYRQFIKETGFKMDSITWLFPDQMGVKPLKEHSETGCTAEHYYYIYFEFSLPVYYLNQSMQAQVDGKWWRWGDGWKDMKIEGSDGHVTSDPFRYQWDIGTVQNVKLQVDSEGNIWSRCEYVRGNCADFVVGSLSVDPKLNSYKKDFGAGDYVRKSASDWKNIGKPKYYRWKTNSDSIGVNIYYTCDLDTVVKHNVRGDSVRMKLHDIDDVEKQVKQQKDSTTYYGFPVIQTVDHSFNAEKKSIDISWDWQGKTDLEYIKDGYWVILRCVDGRYNNEFRQLAKVPLSQKTYRDLAIEFKQSYTYRVHYCHRDWDDKSSVIDSLTNNGTLGNSPKCSTERSVNVSFTKDAHENYIDITIPGSTLQSTSKGLYNVYLYRDDKTAPLKKWENLDQYPSNLVYRDSSSIPDNILTYRTGHQYSVRVKANRPSADKNEEIGEYTDSCAVTGGNSFHRLKASQGFYTDRILLNWESIRPSADKDPDYYAIYRQTLRRDAITPSDEYKLIHETSTIDRYITYVDETAKPGEYYRYKVYLLMPDDNGKQKATCSLETIGYVASQGTISGNVTYQDGTALSGARIDLKALNSQNTQLFETFQRSILTKKMDTLAIDFKSKGFADIKKEHTIQFWYREVLPDSIMQSAKWKHVSISGSKVLLAEYNYSANRLDTVSATFNNLLIKPVLVDSTQQIKIGGFEVYLDELQVWNRQLTPDEVVRYATMHLSGKESGLVAYYPFDEGLPGYAFNHAYEGNMRSSVMAHLGGGTMSNTNTPGVVGFCTYTDINGSYMFSDVPFEGEGTLYAVVPTYGEHDFAPIRIQRFVNANALVYNNVDFEDKSSFLVQGTVTYRYGDFPVEGASIYVDGKPAMRNEKPVVTNEEGRYHFDMPVGYHSITVVMKDHGFANDGRFPAGEDATYDFQQPMYVNFVDTTTVSVVGRVAGGHSIAHLPLSAHKEFGSRANIGKATLYLAPLSNRNYTVNVSESEPVIMPQGEDAIQSTTTLLPYERNGHQAGQIKIETDPTTGEFCALLPPLKYKVVRGETKSVTNEQLRAFDAPQINPVVGRLYTDLIEKADTTYIKFLDKDSVEVDSMIINITPYSIDYHAKVIVQYDTYPTLEITQNRGSDNLVDPNALGEIYIPGMKDDELIPAFESVFGEVDYTLKDAEGNGYPVFASGYDYILELNAYQEFVNSDNEEDEITTIPLSGSTVNLSNFGWGTATSSSAKFNKNGFASIQFTAADPIISDKSEKSSNLYTRNMSLAVSTGTRSYAFPEHGSYDAVFMGAVMDEGTVVIAEGPDVVEFVLRDPPGSESSATLEEGSTYKIAFSKVDTDIDGVDVKQTFSVGGGMKWVREDGEFAGVSPGNKGDTQSWGVDFQEKFNFSTSTSTATTDETSREVTVTTKVSTGSDPAHVGSAGDVYIGTTLFHCYGLANNYTLHRELPQQSGVKYHEFEVGGTTYYLYPQSGVGRGDVLSGQFIYSQRHILETLIPAWTKRRNQYLWPVGTDSTKFVWEDNEAVRFISKYEPTHYLYGREDSYVMVENGTDKNYIDSVQMCNNWINGWKDAISANEHRKVDAKYPLNQSFSSGVTYSDSRTSTFTNTVRIDSIYSYNAVRLFGAKIDTGGESTIQYTGFKEKGSFNIKFSTLAGKNITETDQFDTLTTQKKSLTMSYTLQDNDVHDYLHVKIDTTSFATEGYRFYLAGGATTRPWEGPEKTLYYNAGMSNLSDGTLMVDKPRMSIKNRVVTDVPNGRETSIELQLGNASEIHAAASYRLFLDDSTNPDGLQITCDGYPITGDGHLLNFRADESYTKVLKIRQSRLDVMDYEDVGLYFHAPTYQYFESKNADINPQLTFSVHYKPSCSDVTLDAFDQWQNKIQAVNLGTDSKVVLRASDYNRDYNGFYKLAIERKGEYETQWTPIHVWAVDSAAIERNPDLRGMEVIDSSSVSYLYDMAPLADQTYMFRAVTHGKYGTEEVTFEGDTITIVKDMKAPQVMAYTPTNGILTADDDISVLFNEDVLSTGIVSSNIKVTGVLNEHELAHQDGIRFSSSQNEPIHTTADVSLSGSFSIEMWISEASQSQDEIFTHGKNGLKFGFDNQKRFWVNDPTEYLSDIRVNPSKWSYLSVGVDDDKTLHAYMFYTDTRGVAHQDELLTVPNFEYNARGHISIGKKLEGMVSGVTLWNKYRDMTDMADRSKAHTGRESGLVAYWPMDEGHGLIAADKVGGRHLAVPSADRWYVSSGNYAAHFDKDKKSYIHTGAISIGDDEDYSLEFWFSTVPGKTGDKATLLDMGNGRICLIGGRLCYQPKEGTARQLVSESSDDGDWHHFALRVQRGTSASAFYDGKFSMFAEEGLIGSMNVDAMTLGAHCINPQTKEYAEYLTGGIDELRIWRANMSSQSLLANQYAHIDSTAAGLAMNYSFDHNYYREQTQSWGVQGDTHDHSIYQLPNEANNVTTSSQAPSLTAVALEEPVAFDWVANKEKVVLTITEPAQRIEGCTLNFSLDRVRDMNGNTLTAPVKWSAFVNLNRLVWSQPDAELQTVYGSQQASVTVDVRNNGSELEDWHLEDIPSWLVCSQESGTLTPQAYTHIKFTSREGTPIGYYEAIVYLTGNNGVREPLRITLTVTGDAPDWSVDPSLYEYSDNLTAILKIHGFISEDKCDMVAAFVDNTCIGLAHPFYVEELDNHLTMMTLYSNPAMTGKEVTFKVWCAHTGMIHPVVEIYNDNDEMQKVLLSRENKIYGTPVRPWMLNATEYQENRITLAQGWNWISLNLYGEDEDMMLQKIFGYSSLYYIKDNNYYAEKDRYGRWQGSDSIINNPLTPQKMYAVKDRTGQVATIIGKPAKSERWPIELRKGWNWIGYLPQVPLDLTTALAGADPQEGDIIKGQRLFAYYTQKQWVGTMEYMEPGQGYLYCSKYDGSKTLYYPDDYNTIYRTKPMPAPRQAAPGEPQWEWNPYAYSGNMTVTAEVTLDGDPLNNGMVGAFDEDGICRGYQHINPDSGMLYLLVSGDEVCNLTLRLWDAQTGELHEMEAPFPFASNQIIGHVDSPYVLQFGDPTGIRRNAGDNDDDEHRYDLSGRHAGKDAKGIIVTTGKKQLVK